MKLHKHSRYNFSGNNLLPQINSSPETDINNHKYQESSLKNVYNVTNFFYILIHDVDRCAFSAAQIALKNKLTAI